MKIARIVVFAVVAIIAGCVTINVRVSFPEARFQEVADRIGDEVQGRLHDAPGGGPEGALPARHIASWSFINLAHADDIDITVENPEIEAIKERMKKNFDEYKRFKDNGSVGENLRGYLMERYDGSEDLSLDEERELRKIIQRENADRRELYLALLKANGFDETSMPKIERIFAKSWYKKALRRWYVRYKDPEEGEIWLRKEEWQQRED